MPLLPLLSHQQYSDQSPVVQQMVGLQLRRCRAFNSKHWHAHGPHPLPYKGVLLGKWWAILLLTEVLGIREHQHGLCITCRAGKSDSPSPQDLCNGAEPEVGASLQPQRRGEFPGSREGTPWAELGDSCWNAARQLYINTASALQRAEQSQHCARLRPSAARRQKCG